MHYYHWKKNTRLKEFQIRLITNDLNKSNNITSTMSKYNISKSTVYSIKNKINQKINGVIGLNLSEMNKIRSII